MSGRGLRVGACLSLTGRYGRFGRQAALGLETWRRLDGAADVAITDDESDPVRLRVLLPKVARSCDVLLGPYSTLLARTAARLAPDVGRLVWNHGGAGDDVQVAAPGLLVSVLAPASRYAAPFVRLAAGTADRAPLLIVGGRGSFGRQVAAGAAAEAGARGLQATLLDAGWTPARPPGAGRWDLFAAGSFEEDVAVVLLARGLTSPPRLVGAVAAGVHEFARAVGGPDGVFGVAQWFPGAGRARRPGPPGLGPTADAFLRRFEALAGTPPDYPAAQAAAAAVLAAHCVRVAGSSDVRDQWAVAAGLETATLLGRFGIDGRTGAQVLHEPVLVRWQGGRPVPEPPPRAS